jgi:hypothetical protein
MKLKFAVKKSRSFGYFLSAMSAIIGFVVLGLPMLTQDAISTAQILISVTVISVPVGLFYWIWVDTYYIIDNETLTVKAAL